MLVAIDPGFNGTGIAAFSDEGELRGVQLLVPPGHGHATFAERLRHAAEAFPNVKGAEVIIEFPQTYDGRSSKGDTDDLLKLSALIGTLVTCKGLAGSQIYFVLPAEWKGNVPKDIHHPRILRELGEKELAVLNRYSYACNVSLFHNVIDAVGLGKWWFQNRLFQSKFSGTSSQSVRKKIRAYRSAKSAPPRSRTRK